MPNEGLDIGSHGNPPSDVDPRRCNRTFDAWMATFGHHRAGADDAMRPWVSNGRTRPSTADGAGVDGSDALRHRQCVGEELAVIEEVFAKTVGMHRHS